MQNETGPRPGTEISDGLDTKGPLLKIESSAAIRGVRHPTNERYTPRRYIFAVLSHLGLAIVYALRADLSIASEPMQREFGWSDQQQGYVLSSFFWGYVLFQIPGAIMARRWGGKRVFGLGVLATAVLSGILPVCSRWLWLLYSVRALMGLGEAVTFPALIEMLTHWAPTSERASITTFCYAGSYIGTALSMPICGALIGIGKDHEGVSNTWPLAFYCFGIVGCIWFVLWEVCIASTPAQHSTISAEEKAYLENTTHQDADMIGLSVTVIKSLRVPWLRFFLHPASLSLFFAHFAWFYGTYTMMTYMPKFLNEELGLNMKSAGLVATLPYFLQGITSVAAGLCADHLRLRFHIRHVRLFFLIGAFSLSGCLLVAVSFVTESRVLAVIMMTLSVGLSGLADAGIDPNFQDISPHYAGHLYGISNSISNLAGIVAPIVAGSILLNKTGDAAVQNWRLVFVVGASVQAAAGFLCIVFMQAKPIQSLN